MRRFPVFPALVFALTNLLFCLFMLSSCKEKNAGSTKAVSNDSTTLSSENPANAGEIKKLADSIRGFKPLKLSITEDHSDVDELIPLGYNNHGSFAYLINENSGGASGLHLGILPAYEDFNLLARLDMDEANDTILLQNKELIFYALRSQQVKLINSVQKISRDSLQKIYGIRFDEQKTYGPADPDYDPKKKLLSSVQIRYRQGETEYPSEITHKKFTTSNAIYDVYISDYLVIPGEEGLFGFVVLVTEGRGFEGYTRKSIEVISLGVIKGRD